MPAGTLAEVAVPAPPLEKHVPDNRIEMAEDRRGFRLLSLRLPGREADQAISTGGLPQGLHQCNLFDSNMARGARFAQPNIPHLARQDTRMRNVEGIVVVTPGRWGRREKAIGTPERAELR